MKHLKNTVGGVLLNHRGLTLVEVIVTLSISFVVILAFTEILVDVAKFERASNSAEAGRELVDDIREALEDPNICRASFIGGNPSGDGFTSERIIDAAVPENIRFAVGTSYVNNTVQLVSLSLGRFTPSNPNKDPRLGTVELSITFRKLGSIVGVSDVTDIIFLRVSLDAANRIGECFAPAVITTLWEKSANVGDIYFNSGRVGLGTGNANPQTLLDVRGSGAGTSMRFTRDRFGLVIDPNEAQGGVRAQIASDLGMGQSFSVDGPGLSKIDAFAISKTGGVGVGVQGEPMKLSVAGGIKLGRAAVVVQCDATTEGSLRYVPGNGVDYTRIQVCKRCENATYGWSGLSGRVDWKQCQIVTGTNGQNIGCPCGQIMVSSSNTFTGSQGCVITDTNTTAYIGCGDHYYAYDWHSSSAQTVIKCCPEK